MQVRCPSCSTAYEIPPPVRPRRLRCARCETEWRAMPPDAAAVETVEPTAAVAQEAGIVPVEKAARINLPDVAIDAVPPPAPMVADARAAPAREQNSREGLLWLMAWVLSLVVIAGAVFAAWHGRAGLEHAWPRIVWLFRLLPGGVPG